MGSACSQSVVIVGNTLEPTSRCSSPNTSCTTTNGNVLKTLVSPSIWSPFKLSRVEAEELLSQAEPGAYVFSHDIASELFLSISVGKYVCHHAVVPREHAYYVGARKFSTISDVIDFFKGHPLGETTLTEEYKVEPKPISQVQVKHQSDNQFTIYSPATAPRKPMENEDCKIKSSNEKNVPNEDTKSTFLTNDLNNETSNVNIVLCDALKEGRSASENGTVRSAAALGLSQTQAASFPRRLLAREAAIDNSNISTSSSDREIAGSGLSPLITHKSNRR